MICIFDICEFFFSLNSRPAYLKKMFQMPVVSGLFEGPDSIDLDQFDSRFCIERAEDLAQLITEFDGFVSRENINIRFINSTELTSRQSQQYQEKVQRIQDVERNLKSLASEIDFLAQYAKFLREFGPESLINPRSSGLDKQTEFRTLLLLRDIMLENQSNAQSIRNTSEFKDDKSKLYPKPHAWNKPQTKRYVDDIDHQPFQIQLTVLPDSETADDELLIPQFGY